MPRGFGVAAVRRANFKMPPVANHTAAHFTTQSASGASPLTVVPTDVIASNGDFSTFTIASSLTGAYGDSVVLTGADVYTVYVKSTSPYALIKSATVTVS